MCRLFPCILIFKGFSLIKKCKKSVYVIMLKTTLLLVKNACFGVKKGISEFGTLGSPKTNCFFAGLSIL